MRTSGLWAGRRCAMGRGFTTLILRTGRGPRNKEAGLEAALDPRWILSMIRDDSTCNKRRSAVGKLLTDSNSRYPIATTVINLLLGPRLSFKDRSKRGFPCFGDGSSRVQGGSSRRRSRRPGAALHTRRAIIWPTRTQALTRVELGLSGSRSGTEQALRLSNRSRCHCCAGPTEVFAGSTRVND
ncbi:hypothetical protein R1flu_012206 [Riccia fluitans]|uniref:Uncharacterized protein n=1 Tax=Riccia fluitans TaxID=41844 RepID=A0ABD1ZB44_9MARC